MPFICPTITETTIEDYNKRIEILAQFAERIHPDMMDGVFAPTKTFNLAQVHWPEHLTADIHLMFQKPTEHIETLIALKPHMVILHAEADGDLGALMSELQSAGIKAGLALLQPTTVESQRKLIETADHVLVFSGNLGYHGGAVDFNQTSKIPEIKAINPEVEIGWDGGVNAEHARSLMEAGVDVLNTGGFVAHADDQAQAYQTLVDLVS